MTQVLSNENQGLVFEIISARIYDESEDKKHVIYSLQVRHIAGSDDLSPSVIERRYTHFLNLYNSLKNDHPQLMAKVNFPRKVLMGNFDNSLISMRSTGFESLLQYISTESTLRTSKAFLDFLQGIELEKAKSLLEMREFLLALPILEKNFTLLSKVFTDRSPPVLLSLCRLLICCISIPGFPKAQKWSDLALHRYDGVSDGDLLELYVPLIQCCIKVWWQVGRDTDVLHEKIKILKRRGINIDEKSSLMDKVNEVEKKIYSY